MIADTNCCIINCGAMTPVGTSAQMSVDMISAGISRLMTHPEFKDFEDEPILMGIASYLDDDISMIERFTGLALPALDETIALLDQLNITNETIPVWVGMPSERLGLPEGINEQVKERLAASTSSSSNRFPIEIIPNGHASAVMALEKACQAIQSGQATYCVIGGVDSYNEKKMIDRLENDKRLLTIVNRFGFIPGEAAGFCLLTSIKQAKAEGLSVSNRILSVATEMEPHPIGSEGVCIGQGLTKAINAVTESLPKDQKISNIFCDLNGEPYRTDEYGFTGSRLTSVFQDYSNFTAPTDTWGDVGAASAPLLMLLATESERLNQDQNDYNLIWTSSDQGERSAIILEMGTIT